MTLALPGLPTSIGRLALSMMQGSCILGKFPVSTSKRGGCADIPRQSFTTRYRKRVMANELVKTPTSGMGTHLTYINGSVHIFNKRPGTSTVCTFCAAKVASVRRVMLATLPRRRDPYQLRLVSPFIKILTRGLPGIYISFQGRSLVRHNFDTRLRSLLPMSSSCDGDVLRRLCSFIPTSACGLSRCIHFEAIESIFIRFIGKVHVDRLRNGSIVQVLRPSVEEFDGVGALILLSKVPFSSRRAVLGCSTHLVRCVRHCANGCAFNKRLCSKVISFVARQKALPSVHLSGGSRVFSCRFPRGEVTFITPSCGSRGRTNSHLPSFQRALC